MSTAERTVGFRVTPSEEAAHHVRRVPHLFSQPEVPEVRERANREKLSLFNRLQTPHEPRKMDLRRILNEEEPEEEREATASSLRNGKWTEEEERYAAALVKHFLAGELSVQSGVSLRRFLAKKLRCSPMRISTKLSMDTLGDMAIPKKLGQKRFFPVGGLTTSQRDRVMQKLERLEADFCLAEGLQIADESEEVEDELPQDEAAPGSPVRVGSWSHEEQIYACALIDGFVRGLVDVADGLTLRAYLAERLCCNPMRISKKLSTCMMGSTPLPKRLGSTMFSRQTDDPSLIVHTERHLERLRQACFPTAPKRMFELQSGRTDLRSNVHVNYSMVV